MSNIEETKQWICDVCHKMWQLGWVAANDGNISVKVGEDAYLCTPTGVSKGFMTPEYICKVNGRGELKALKDIDTVNGPEACIGCGMCTHHCPQSIDIPTIMAEIAGLL